MKTPPVLRALALPALAIALLALPACSTPQTRAQDNPAIMQSLSPSDRAIVLNHRIRVGLSKPGVFIAFGRPDRIFRGANQAGALEAWIYTTTEYVYAGGFAAFPTPIYSPDVFWARGRGRFAFRGAYGGYSGFYYSPYVGVQVPSRRVMFQQGRVVAFEELPY